MIFALAGNQNCGKTTLFNALTGSNQHVGNFPGVTVDQKSGEVREHKECTVVDLPGIYSLRTYTQEEIVTRDYILNQKPDGIINIVDATNIERNLYLTLQLLELRVPMVLALNMMDEVRANGGTIDVQKLSDDLGIPVVPITAAKGEGVSELMDRAVETAKNRVLPKVYDFCAANSPVHRCVHAVVHLIEDHAERLGLPPRFCATKLSEGDRDMADRLVLRVSAYTDTESAVSVCAMEPLENICYALSVLNDQVSAGKLSLLLTASGQARKSGGRFSGIDETALNALLQKGTAYYSDRYACAYVEAGDTTAWYLDGRALDARRQLLNCFGVNSLCLSTLNGTLRLTEN